MTKHCSEADSVIHMKRIAEGELWYLVETGGDNFKITRVTDNFMKCENTEDSSRALAEVLYGENRNYWILITRYRIVN